MSKYTLIFLALCLMLPLQAQNTQARPDPVNYLDAPLPTTGGKALKIEIGGNNFGATYQNYNVHSILQMVLNNNLFHDNDLNDSINYFLNVWPPASEMVALDQPTVYQQQMQRGGSYIVNESGRLISQDDVNSNSLYQNDLNASQTVAGQKLYASYVEHTRNGVTYFSRQQVNEYNAGNQATRAHLQPIINQLIDSYGLGNSWKNANQTIAYPDRNSGLPNGFQWGEVGQVHNSITITTGAKKYVLQESIVCSPIVLDMDGDGKIEASEGKWMPHGYQNARVVEFDMDGDGMLDMVEWVGPNDGILMVTTGSEVNGRNFFGDIDGFVNGYQKLSTLDKNGDKKLTEDELATLSVWQDKNGNAKIDQGEVKSVTALGITSISVVCDKEFVSSFVQNGQERKMWDWYPCMFRLKRTK